MGCLRVILGDQLSASISSLRDCDRQNDVVLMCEVLAETTYVKHHKKKIAFVLSAMRHFARELTDRGYKVDYIQLDAPENTGSIRGETQRALERHEIQSIVVTFPGEFRLLTELQGWEERFGLSVEIREDDRFLCTLREFEQWSKGRKRFRMEPFYRDIRRKYDVLMDGDEPEGGRWNYDSENRKPPKEGLSVPAPYSARTDDITDEVIQLVAERFGDHFGSLDPFFLAVTRDQALYALNKFIDERLSNFGDFQDAMIEGEPWMYHSHLSFYLNAGLLTPLECARKAEEAYEKGEAGLNAVEGFVRQIVGWREYVRGIYWLNMPSYAKQNFLEAKRSLPDFYWTGDTKMNCLKQCVIETRRNAYAHHIQRLMVLGNFALLAGIDPKFVNEWYLIVYADAYEWVELPNVTGMILYADGGLLGSKPYAASGNYINKMSTYCKTCQFDVSQKTGEDACPFNYLYWDFLIRNRKKIGNNQRLGMAYRTLDKMCGKKAEAFQQDAGRFFRQLKSE